MASGVTPECNGMHAMVCAVQVPDCYSLELRELLNGFHFFTKRLGSLAPFGILVQELMVFLERRTATGRVNDNHIEIQSLENSDVVPSTSASLRRSPEL
jgi:hypothetical protein